VIFLPRCEQRAGRHWLWRSVDERPDRQRTPRRGHRAPQPARQRPHHPHWPLPRPAPSTTTRPQRLPRPQHPRRRRSSL